MPGSAAVIVTAAREGSSLSSGTLYPSGDRALGGSGGGATLAPIDLTVSPSVASLFVLSLGWPSSISAIGADRDAIDGDLNLSLVGVARVASSFVARDMELVENRLLPGSANAGLLSPWPLDVVLLRPGSVVTALVN